MLWTLLLATTTTEFDVFLAQLDVACAHIDSVRAKHALVKRAPVPVEEDFLYTDE